jgi:hypothetical protein
MSKLSCLSLRGALDAHDTGFSYKRGVAAGAALGLAWGVVSRLWMRLISDDPEFTISGTSIILGASVFVGACAGLAYAARRRGTWRRAWIPRTLAVVSFAALAIGPGVLVVPTVLFGTLALARGSWPRWARWACALPAVAGYGFIVYAMLHFWPPLNTALYVALYLLLLYPLVVAMRTGLGTTAGDEEAATPARAETKAAASLPMAA